MFWREKDRMNDDELGVSDDGMIEWCKKKWKVEVLVAWWGWNAKQKVAKDNDSGKTARLPMHFEPRTGFIVLLHTHGSVVSFLLLLLP